MLGQTEIILAKIKHIGEKSGLYLSQSKILSQVSLTQFLKRRSLDILIGSLKCFFFRPQGNGFRQIH